MIKFIEIRILHHKFKKKIDELGFGFIKKELYNSNHYNLMKFRLKF